MQFISRELFPETYVNVMDQYHPCHRATEHLRPHCTDGSAKKNSAKR
ncbi:hypothetical protein [Trichloromonas sp.]|nr:hypothetical protein [Trichloromonas sp.]